MIIAVISDIHGNLPAMQSVMRRVEEIGASKILVLGDMVGYYYQVAEVLKLLQDFIDVKFIQGNHEAFLKKAGSDEDFLEKISKKYGSGIKIALDSLDACQIEWLINLPEKKMLNIQGKKILMCHGSPKSQDDYIYPNSNIEKLNDCAISGYDYVLMGNTHYPFICRRSGVTLLNPGSVGQPRDIGSLASFASIDTVTDSVVFYRIPFDYNKVANMVNDIDPDLPYLKGFFSRGMLNVAE